MKVYQVLVVSRAIGFNFIVPDVYVYQTFENAMRDVLARQRVFEEQGEILTYRGRVRTIAEISEIYQEHDLINNTNDAYIYELDVK